jgi:glycosyltransferase involved in cell wall biosynthesis
MSKVVVTGGYADSLVRFRGELLKAMARHGHEVVACAPDAEPRTVQALAELGARYVDVFIDRAGLNPIKDLKTIYSLYRLQCQNAPDVVFQYTIKPVIFGSLAARLAGVPAIYSMVTGLGYSLIGGGGKKNLLALVAKLLYRWSLKYNRAVFFQNPDNLEFFVSHKLVPRDKAVLVNGSGINLVQFPVTALPKEQLSFLLIARLLKDKGIREYAKAAELLWRKYPRVKFKLVGWIDHSNPAAVDQAELQSWVEGGYIEYLGQLDDVRPAIAASSVYVLPSYSEGTPRTVLEAMAMGRPIVTTDVPGCRETVVDGDNGFLVPAKDVEALAGAMERFIDNPALLERMGARSRAVAEEKYDVHKVNAVVLRHMGLL